MDKEELEKILEHVEKKLTEAALNSSRYVLDEYDIEKIFNELRKEYDLNPHYPTLREYIKEHECGSYHEFVFKLGAKRVFVADGIAEFISMYNENMLDDYVVIEDKEFSVGEDCTNYCATHNLTVKHINEC